MAANVNDSGFDGPLKRRSQRGNFAMLADEKFFGDPSNKYEVRCVGLQSSKIQRALRFPLPAEA